MALLYIGTGTRSAGIRSAILKQFKSLTLKPVKTVTFTFDPFGENSKTIRESMFWFSVNSIIATNPKCKFVHEVVCDRREPTIKFVLDTGESILLKCNNLNSLDVVKLYNKHITSLVPKEAPPPPPAGPLKSKKPYKPKGKRTDDYVYRPKY